MSWIRKRMESITLGDIAFPLLILAAIYFFDEFDTAAFGVLAPKIKDAFMVLIVPIVIFAIIAMRLPKVDRGHSDDPEAAAVAEEEPPVPFQRAVRMLWTVRTLRRQYMSWIFIGAGFLPLAVYVPLYFDRVFDLNPLEIGIITATGSAFGLVAVNLGGRWTQRWLAQGLGEPLKWAGLSLV